MKFLPFATLIIAGIAVVGCGTTRENRYNETVYADHNGPYDHDVVYRSTGYNDRYYDDNGRAVYVQPAYRLVPVTPRHVIQGSDGYYYYSD